MNDEDIECLEKDLANTKLQLEIAYGELTIFRDAEKASRGSSPELGERLDNYRRQSRDGTDVGVQIDAFHVIAPKIEYETLKTVASSIVLKDNGSVKTAHVNFDVIEPSILVLRARRWFQ
jgi:hypothetical protein